MSSNSDKSSSDDSSSAHMAVYQITHVKRTMDSATDLLALSVCEAERGKIKFIIDTGATVSFIKLKTLKDDAISIRIHKGKIEIIGFTLDYNHRKNSHTYSDPKRKN